MGFEPTSSGFPTSIAPHTHVLYKTPTILQTVCVSWAKSGKGKKLRPLNWIFSFRKFRRKVNVVTCSKKLQAAVFDFPQIVHQIFPDHYGKAAAVLSLCLVMEGPKSETGHIKITSDQFPLCEDSICSERLTILQTRC